MDIIAIQVFVSGWEEEVIETSPASAVFNMQEAERWHSWDEEAKEHRDNRVRFGAPVLIASAWPRRK